MELADSRSRVHPRDIPRSMIAERTFWELAPAMKTSGFPDGVVRGVPVEHPETRMSVSTIDRFFAVWRSEVVIFWGLSELRILAFIRSICE